MKKTYNSPDIIVVKIATVGMLAESFTVNNNDDLGKTAEQSLGHESDADWDDEEY